MEVDLNDVAVFNEVVASGSFTAAGQKLGLPPSAVSRRVARLEERLGTKLLNRTTRSLGLTDSGRIYHEHTSKIGLQIEQAAKAVNDSQSSPTGLVRLTAPPDDGGVIWGLVVGFLEEHPRVDLEVIHTLEYLDLVEEGIDIALRGGAPPDSTVFSAHQLFDSRILLVASPQYLARRGVPGTARDLEGHDCLAMDNWAPNAIRAVEGESGPVRLALRNRLRVNRLDTVRQAALAGFGIAPLLHMTCWQDLEAGALVEVLPGALPPHGSFWAVYPAGRKISAAAKALLDHMVGVAPSLMPTS